MASRNEPSGAIAAAEYWLAALDWAYATGDPELARSLYAPTCAECKRFVKIFDDTDRSGEHIQGGRLTQSEVDLVADDSRLPGSTVVDLTFSQEALVVYNAAGKQIDREAKQVDTVYRFWLVWRSGSWHLADLKQAIIK